MSVYAYTIFDDPLVRVGPKAAYARAEKPLDIRVHNLRGHEVDIAEITDLGGVSPIGGTFQRGWARRSSSRLLPRVRAMYIPSRSL